MDALHELARTLGIDAQSIEVVGADPVLPTCFRIGEAAAAALGVGAASALALLRERSGQEATARIEVRAAAASLMSFALLDLNGRNPLAGRAASPTTALYRARDGRWIHLHGGFPTLRDGTLRLLGCEDSAESIAAAVAERDAGDLENTLAEALLCGSVVRSEAEWRAHPQGLALATRPVVEVLRIGEADPEPLPRAERPLAGVRVLDLTRVLAGPTCARSLAEHGAEVLHVRSPDLPSIEPFVMDTNHGKRSCHLALDRADGHERLRSLVRSADVFSQGYRGGALAKRGFGAEELCALRPGLVYVSINCYGYDGPWSDRPGWEQLAQAASGIALENGAPDAPRLLPAAANDYTTGYLAALGTIHALLRRAREGGSYHVRVSLARTAMWIQDLGRVAPGAAPAQGMPPEALAPYLLESETPWGRLRHLGPVLQIPAAAPRWQLPVVPLGTHQPTWL